MHAGLGPELAVLLSRCETAQGAAFNAVCEELRALVSRLRPPYAVCEEVARRFQGRGVMVRSSANVEDLAGLSGAGLYDSLANVPSNDPERFGAAVAEVWASLYTERAAASRRAARVPQRDAFMAVLVQEMMAPEVSFVLHTHNPITGAKDEAYAELALGLGETLASGAVAGTPWRLAMNRHTGEASVLAFANFSTAFIAGAGGGMESATVDYSSHWLTTDANARAQLSQRLVHIGNTLEHELGEGQDIEGGVLRDGTICIVQARPQP